MKNREALDKAFEEEIAERLSKYIHKSIDSRLFTAIRQDCLAVEHLMVQQFNVDIEVVYGIDQNSKSLWAGYRERIRKPLLTSPELVGFESLVTIRKQD